MVDWSTQYSGIYCSHQWAPMESFVGCPQGLNGLNAKVSAGLQVIKDGDLYAAGGPLPLPVLAVCNGGEYLNRLTNPPPPEDPDERRMLGAPESRCECQHARLCFIICSSTMDRLLLLLLLLSCITPHRTCVTAALSLWPHVPGQPAARFPVHGLSSGKAGACPPGA